MQTNTPIARPAPAVAGEAERLTIRELEALIERLRLIVSAQARLIGRLSARLPADDGDEP